MNTTMTEPQDQTRHQDPARPQQLDRPTDDRMIAGVASGIARYLNVDATLVRVIIAALALFTGAGAALYLAGWLLIPEEGAEQSIASQFIESRRGRSH